MTPQGVFRPWDLQSRTPRTFSSLGKSSKPKLEPKKNIPNFEGVGTFLLILDSMILESWLSWVEWLIQGPQARKVNMSSLIFGSWGGFGAEL